MARGLGGLPREVHDGLCEVLTSIALTDAPQQRVGIVTTAPSQWLDWVNSGNFEIVDISRITGMTGWQSDSDVLSSVIDAARNAGWPNESIDLDFHGPITTDMPRPATTFRPDIVLKESYRGPCRCSGGETWNQRPVRGASPSSQCRNFIGRTVRDSH